MAGQRVIASNRIPRVNIANRGIAVPPAIQAGAQAPAAAQDQIGSVGWYAAGQQPANYQDVQTQPGMLSTTAYARLLAVQGALTGRNITLNPVLANAGAPNWNLQHSCVWKGQIYSTDSLQKIAKRASLFAGPPTVLGFAGLGAATVNSVVPSQQGNFLLQAGGNAINGTTASWRVISDDVTASAIVTTPMQASGGMCHALFEATGGVLLALTPVGGPIFRSTNTGASWTAITGNLSIPADRRWAAIWASGATIYMIGEAMAIASSVDAGVTWTVNAAVPNSGNIHFMQDGNAALANSQAWPSVALDLVGRRGYALTNATPLGGVLSWSLDTPTTGYVQEVGANYFAPMAAATIWMFGTPYGLIVLNLGLTTPTRGGLYFAKYGPAGSVSAFFFGTSTASLPVYQGSNPAGLCLIAGNSSGICLGDGLIGFDQNPNAGALAASFGVADMVTLFDRYTWAPDPGLPSGRKPYVRVL